jgi:hypothetical protein
MAQPGVQPMYGQAPTGSTPSNSNSKIKSVVIVAILVAAVAFIAVAVLYNSKTNKNPVSQLKTAVTGSSDVESRSDGTLDMSKLIDKQSSIKDQDITAKLNQQVNLSDGTTYMVTAVQRNFVSSSDYLKADAGKELIKISLVVGNRALEGNDYISDSNFQLRNSAGGLQDPEYVATTDMADALKGDEIAPGKQEKGAIVFQVDQDEKVPALVTSDEYTNYTSNAKITVKSEVSLQ